MLIESRLKTRLETLASQGLTRRRRLLESPCGPRAIMDGREVLAFASNDYLGLASHPRLTAALKEGAEHWGTGSGASHLVSGHLAPHEALEIKLAKFTGFPRAISLSSGYMANLAILPTLAGRGDAIFADKLNHASLIDSVQLSRAESYRYPHKDIVALERQLSRSEAKTKIIVTDAVFSMDGDLAALPQLFELAERFDAWLVVDDAHGFGVLGPQGTGSLAHLGLSPHPRILLMGTLGKAAGVSGAFIAGSEIAIEALLQGARSYIFTTAQPPAIACALQTSLDLITEGDQRRQHLQNLIQQLQSGLQGLPWNLLPSQTAIQPLVVGSNEAALSLAQELWNRDIWVPAIRPPTVPAGTARLRISLSASHSHEDVDLLIRTLKELS